MDAFRTSNASYIRHSGFLPPDEHVPNNTDVRIKYEQQQVYLIKILKILGVFFLILSLPFFYNLFRYGGVTNECGERQPWTSAVTSPFYWLFGINRDSRCKRDVSTDFKIDDNYQIETTTETTTCQRGEDDDNPLTSLLGGSHDFWTTESKRVTGATEGGDDGGNKGSFWDYFSIPSFGCSEFNRHNRYLEDLDPSVHMFKQPMPTLEEVTKNYQSFAKGQGDLSKLSPLADSDKVEAREYFDRILSPATQWKTADESTLGALVKKPLNWLLNNKNVFSVQNFVADWQKSKSNLAKKKSYVSSLKGRVESLPNNSERCVQRQLAIDAQLTDENSRLSMLLAEKSNLDNQIQENQIKLNSFVSQRNSKEQEPINTVRKLDADLHDLSYKVKTIPGIQKEIEARRASIQKSQSVLVDLGRKLDTDATNSVDLEAKIGNYLREIEGLKRQIEANKIKLAMRKMKLQLANSNRQIKEHLMSLIRTNNGEPVDFQVLFSTSENARREIRRILRDFINQSAGTQVEINISEEQIDDIISKDQKEFEEIRRIYTELVAIINQYGDFNIYISGIAQDIKDLDQRLKADDKHIQDLQRKIAEARAALDGQSARKVGWISEISRLEKLIADNQRWIDDKDLETRQYQDEYDKLKLRKDLYVQEHKVG
jgi:hypothetical protein